MDTNRKPSPAESPSPTAAYAPFSLDLTALSGTRGNEPSEAGPQRLPLPSSTLDLTLTLPLASRTGSYEINLTSADRTFWSNSAVAELKRGKTLIRVAADFREIPNGNYNLELESATGIRLVQPVSIQAVLPRNSEQKP